MPAHKAAAVNFREGMHQPCAIYCGAEGFLSYEEFEARTAAAVNQYAKEQPLKWRQANLPTREDGTRAHSWDFRTKLPQPA